MSENVSFRLVLRGKRNGVVEIDRFLGDRYIYLEIFDDSADSQPMNAVVTIRPSESRQIRKALKQAEKAIRA